MNLGADILSQPFANKRYNPRVGIFFKDKSMLCITIGTWDQDTALCDGGNKSRCAWLRKFKLLRKLKTCSFYYFVISLPSFTFTGPPKYCYISQSWHPRTPITWTQSTQVLPLSHTALLSMFNEILASNWAIYWNKLLLGRLHKGPKGRNSFCSVCWSRMRFFK